MDIKVRGIEEGQPVPEEFAFGVYNEQDHMSFGPNRNPEVTWEGAPEGTRSLVIMMFDPDVPSVADDANQEGQTVSKDIPRVDFFHWLLIDVPATTSRIPEGVDSDGVIPKGKDPGPGPVGIRGVNNFTQFLADNPDMAGTYGGYDGPCPPWNDEIVHRYIFTVFALDVEHLELGDEFRGPDVEKAMAGHILDEASVMATYTLNPDLR